jgi:hypothetical protein
MLGNQYTTHFLNHKVLFAFQVISLSMPVLEWDHPDNSRYPFGINDPDAIYTKVLAQVKCSIRLVEHIRICICEHFDSRKSVLCVVLCGQEEVQDLNETRGSLEAQLDQLVIFICFERSRSS